MKCMFYWRSDLKMISKIGMLYGHIYDQKRNSKKGTFFGECGIWKKNLEEVCKWTMYVLGKGPLSLTKEQKYSP